MLQENPGREYSGCHLASEPDPGPGPEATEAALRGRISADPNDLAATIPLALLLMDRADLPEAEVHARNAIRLAPTNAQAHHVLAMVLTEAHRPHAGEHHYRRALELTGERDPILLANLGWNLRNQGRMDEARRLYEESVKAAPYVAKTLLGWARLEEADRRFEQASRILDEAEARFSPDPHLMLTRAVLLGRSGEPERALAVLDRLAAISPGGLGPEAWVELGALLDRLGRYDEAFAAFAAGKRRVRASTGHSYDAARAQDLAERLQRFFTARRRSILPQATVAAGLAQPIFVLGFPRSGTTLVEQILSSHPLISAGDELPLVEEMSNAVQRLFTSPLSYPESLAELWMAEHQDGLDVLRDHYLRRAQQMGAVTPGANWFTDKMPLNETHLGLISLVFPRSPLIHLQRHPLDVMLSVFSNHMTHGHFCSYELETAARHFVLMTELVEHYQRELNPNLLRVRYEDLVRDLETGVRRMLEFVGVPFDRRCVQFHENRRFARTASYAQVTQKLYRRSCFRYRNYMRHMEPVIPILRPVIERLGYTID